MKKLLVAIGILFLLAAAGLGVFLATFDADRYRPRLVSEAHKALHRPVTLERLSLGWHGGIALRLQGVAIYEGPAASGEPLIRVESASALVRLGPLLRKSVDVSSILLNRPHIRLSRDPQGQLNLAGLAAAGAPIAAAGTSPAASGPGSPGAGAVSFQVDEVRVIGGSLHWIDAMVSPPTDLWVRSLDVSITHIAPGRPMQVEVSGAVAGQQPNVRASGQLVLPDRSRASSRDGARSGSVERLSLAIDRLPLEPLLPASTADAPHFQGRLTLTAQGALPTLDPAQWLPSLSASGTVRLDDGKIANLNILREVFTRLSMLPGLVERLESRLPPEYRAKLAANETVLAPIDLPVRIQGGLLQLDRFDVRTDTVGLAGSGTVGLAGSTHVQGVLRVDPTFSAAVIQSVNELQRLTNASGELEIPVTIQGQGAHIAVIPDLNYVASRVIMNKVVDVLGALLEQRRGDASPPEGAEPPATPQEADPLGQLLHRALQRYVPEPSAPQPAQPSQP
ncbi:MAG: AsmA family protein [Candidatus Omnitrophica bacterium]|nr:AsmA family protein [Candidatus Omnitrophota bacterium]